MYTGFVKRCLPRSSPKNAAAPLYQPPVLPAPLLLQWATGASAAGKRKRDPDHDDDSAYAVDEDEDEDDGKSGSE